MAVKADHLLSCTYRENEIDLHKAWDDWRKFVRKVKETIGEFRYVVVAERQKRGAIHFHAAVVGFQDVRMLRSVWRSVVVDGRNIDVQATRTDKGYQWKRHKLARYLSKYMSKEFDEDGLSGRHRYRCSQGILIPSVTSTFHVAMRFTGLYRFCGLWLALWLMFGRTPTHNDMVGLVRGVSIGCELVLGKCWRARANESGHWTEHFDLG